MRKRATVYDAPQIYKDEEQRWVTVGGLSSKSKTPRPTPTPDLIKTGVETKFSIMTYKIPLLTAIALFIMCIFLLCVILVPRIGNLIK